LKDNELEVSDMLAVQGYYDGATFQPLEKTKVLPNQKVIITIMDEFVEKPKTTEEDRLKLVEELSGSLAAYAIKDGRSIDEIMELENKAWEQAVIEKYGNA
jgi:hypothetical protein